MFSIATEKMVINIWEALLLCRGTNLIIVFLGVISSGSQSEFPVPSGEVLFCFGVIDRETVKVDVARALGGEREG